MRQLRNAGVAFGFVAMSAAGVQVRAQVVEPELRKKVLLIGIDGVRPDVLHEVRTPHLDSLKAQGLYSAQAQTTLATVSGPAWSSMLTGVWPEKHGVTSNDFTGNHYTEFPDFLTRVEQVRPEFYTFVVADWLPLVTQQDGGPTIGNAIDQKVVLDGYALGWDAADDSSVAIAVHQLSTADPDVAFVYLGNPDETSHQAGSIGIEYRAAIAGADQHVGRLIAAVRSRRTYHAEDWLILVSTDHGRRPDGGHGGVSPAERTIFFLAHGPSVTPGVPASPPNIVDVAVTALLHLGIELDPAWKLDGRMVAVAGR